MCLGQDLQRSDTGEAQTAAPRSVKPITVYSYGFLFYCATVGQASDSMMALT